MLVDSERAVVIRFRFASVSQMCYILLCTAPDDLRPAPKLWKPAVPSSILAGADGSRFCACV